MEFMMTDAEPNHKYMFRVCHRQAGGYNDGICGPWSLPKKAWTTLEAHGMSEIDFLYFDGFCYFYDANVL